MGGGQSAVIPLFSLDNQTSMYPEAARGDDTPTFVRDTTASVADMLGVIRTAKANEWRSKGARRVENLIVASEDMTNAAWEIDGAGVLTDTTATFTVGSEEVDQSVLNQYVNGVFVLSFTASASLEESV